MNPFEEQYQSKLTTPRALAEGIKPGDAIHLGVWYGYPYGVANALGQFCKGIDPLYISVVFSTFPWAFFSHPGARILTGFFGPIERESQRRNGNVFFTPVQYSDGLRMIRDARPFSYIVHRVAPMDERGFFNFSLTASWEYSAIRWVAENRPETRVVLEVNPNMPRVPGLPEHGDNELHVSQVHHIVEDKSSLMEFPTAPPTETETLIAANVAALIEDKSTIQLGFGNIPMAIGKLLCARKELGIHTEMFCEAHIDMVEAGSITNAHKGVNVGKSVATFGLGTRRLHQWLRDNKTAAMLPADEVNSVLAIARNYRMTSVNSALTVDFAGQTCAHCIGPKTYSGLGGAFEFAYGSQLSPGGKSVICLPSTTKLKDGSVVSNIVPRHPLGSRITVPEHVVDWIVTEFGAARLKFLNMEERAAALIDLAHPDHREDLARQARDNGLRMDALATFRKPPESFFARAGG